MCREFVLYTRQRNHKTNQSNYKTNQSNYKTNQSNYKTNQSNYKTNNINQPKYLNFSNYINNIYIVFNLFQ